MKVAGIDLSTKKIAVSVLEDDKASEFLEFTAKGQRSHDRLEELSEKFREWVNSTEVELFFIEDISFTRNRRSELDLATVMGVVIAHIYAVGKVPMKFNNMTVKKAFNLSRSSKQDVIKLVEKRLGVTGVSEDVADAFMVALYGSSLTRGVRT